MSAHTFIPQPVATSPDHKPFYRWKCSCGSESANFYGFKVQAERAHADHAAAKSAG